MKVIEPTPLMREAAAILEPILDDVVVIGAVAVAVALSRSQEPAAMAATRDLDLALLPITPTADVDLAVELDTAPAVVAELQRAGLQPSQEPGERGYTWQRDELKVQLMSPPAPPRMGRSVRLPVQAALGIVAIHHLDVAFAEEPERRRMRCASPAALVAVKRAAFGRRRPGGEPVERDYHDVFQLIMGAEAELLAEAVGDAPIAGYLAAAAEDLARGEHATVAAAREHLQLGLAPSQRAAERAIVRGARSFLRELELHRGTPRAR